MKTKNWSVKKHGLMWLLIRPMTGDECEAHGTMVTPMSILGISKDGLACVCDKDDAELIVRAVNNHAALMQACQLASKTIRGMIFQLPRGCSPALKAEYELHARLIESDVVDAEGHA